MVDTLETEAATDPPPAEDARESTSPSTKVFREAVAEIRGREPGLWVAKGLDAGIEAAIVVARCD